MSSRPYLTLVPVLGLCLGLAACGGKPPASGQATPAAGRASPALTPAPSHGTGATPRRKAGRIVSLVPAVTEMLYAIGAGPRMVGVSSFDTYPPDVKSLPKVGGLLDPDIERIISLRPDLVIISEAHTGLGAKLAEAGIATFPYALGDLANVTRTMGRLGAATGFEWQASLVAKTIESHLASVRDRVKSLAKVRTMIVFGRQPGALREIYVSGGIGFLHDLVELAGGANVFGGVKREAVQASTESILAAAPDAIVELRYGRPTSSEELGRERQSWNQLGAVPAVKSGRVYLLVGDELVVPGPRVADTAERIARALHPEGFKQ
jgi:iron complex transport system substrate-binding protein